MIGWLIRSRAELPRGDGWLSDREREVLAGLRSSRRAGEWRLGRWAAKQAVCSRCGCARSDVEIVSAESGAPEALVGGRPAPVALSLAHRGGRALVVVADRGTAVGCDLEPVEPRSGAFVRTWFSSQERAALHSTPQAGRAELANLIWTAKEAATKLRGEGLRLDPRQAVVEVGRNAPTDDGWRPLTVRWEPEMETVEGWWRAERGWVYACLSEPRQAAPAAL